MTCYSPWAIKPLGGLAVSQGLLYVNSFGFGINSNWHGTCPSFKRLNVSAWCCMNFTSLKWNWEKKQKKGGGKKADLWAKIKKKVFSFRSCEAIVSFECLHNALFHYFLIIMYFNLMPGRIVRWNFTSRLDKVTDGMHSFSILSISRTISSKVFL